MFSTRLIRCGCYDILASIYLHSLSLISLMTLCATSCRLLSLSFSVMFSQPSFSVMFSQRPRCGCHEEKRLLSILDWCLTTVSDIICHSLGRGSPVNSRDFNTAHCCPRSHLLARFQGKKTETGKKNPRNRLSRDKLKAFGLSSVVQF